jgi:hypothetical protein
MRNLTSLFFSFSFFIETTYSYEPFITKNAYFYTKEHEGYISLFECNKGLILVNFDLMATRFNLSQVTLHSFGYIVNNKNYNSAQLSVCRYIYE